MPSAGTITPGTRFGPYEIIAPLGAGGMGEVYRARDTRLGRDVALKVLPTEFTDDPDRRARFEREARAVAALNHPNLVVLHDFGTEGGIPYAVMELLEGATLRERIRHGALPWRKAVEFAVAIADALGEAHARGIVHRDIKPENVFVTAEGRIKVLDFGLARIDPPTSPDEGTTQEFDPGPTRPGAVLGTAPYMSPEQLRGQPVDVRSDLFSFGCVLYEMLAGKRPFTGATQAEVTAAILRAEPAQLSEAIPREVQRIVLRCLEKTVEARAQSARDQRDRLQALLTESGPVTTTPPPPRQRRPLLLAAGLGLAVGAICFALGMWVQPARESGPRAWQGDFLFGDMIPAFGPRVSPDGQWVAFLVLHEGQPQVAVLSLLGGEPRLLTHKSKLGNPQSLCWSADSKWIFFDRYVNVPIAVYRVSPLYEAKEPEWVLDGAESPQVLKDGSLVACRLDEDGNSRLVRFRRDREPYEQEVGPLIKFVPGWPQPVRALRGSNRVVFCGHVVGDEKIADPKRRLYLLDLEADNPTPIELWDQNIGLDFVQIAVSPDDEFVYTSLPAGDVYHIVRLPFQQPPGGRAQPQPLLTLMGRCYGLDMDKEGRLYLDQLDRPMEVLRFDPEERGPPRRIASTSRAWESAMADHPPLELPDDRGVLLSSAPMDRGRLLTVGAGIPKPLLADDREASMGPTALLGERDLAYVSGPQGERRIKLVRLEAPNKVLPIRTLKGILADGVTTLTASGDGSKLYYVREDGVYEFDVPTRNKDEQRPRLVSRGNGVAVHPVTGELLIQHFHKGGVRLSRLAKPGAEATEVPVKETSVRMAAKPIGDHTIHPDGRVLVTVTSPDIWYWGTAVLNQDGSLTPLLASYEGDLLAASWCKDGKTILATGYPFRSNLYRFTPPK